MKPLSVEMACLLVIQNEIQAVWIWFSRLANLFSIWASLVSAWLLTDFNSIFKLEISVSYLSYFLFFKQTGYSSDKILGIILTLNWCASFASASGIVLRLWGLEAPLSITATKKITIKHNRLIFLRTFWVHAILSCKFPA